VPLPEFEYIKPKTVQETASLLTKHGEDAKVFAGGTDLLVLMRSKVVKPKYLIDVKGVKELRELSHEGKSGLKIGAAVTLNEIIELDVVRERFGALWSAANSLADPTLRNRATLAGNICNASPASDAAPALLVLNAEVDAVGKEGERTIPIREFFTGVKRTSLKQGEFVKAVRIPNPPDGAKGDYLKWGRTRGEDLAVVGVAALVGNSGKKLMRIALSSVAPTPLLVKEAEKIPEESGSVEEQIEKAVSIVTEKVCPITDVRCCKEYRTHMAAVLTRRILRKLLEAS